MKTKPAQQKATKTSVKVQDLKPKTNPKGGDTNTSTANKAQAAHKAAQAMNAFASS